jgi:hypothetical protein
MSAGALSEAGVVTQKAFDEFHLYTLPGPVTLRDRESKQVEFLSAQNLKVSTIYRYAGSELYNGGGFYEDPNVTLNSAENVSVVRKIVNSESNYLGKPLPAGTLRFYRKDGQDIQFIGEDSIKHTAKNETVEVVTGKAFDVLVKRVRTSFNVEPAGYLAQRKMTESFEFTIKNRKGEDVVVNVVEYFRGPNWEIKGQSHTHRKTSAAEVQWDVPVGKDSEEKLTYVVEYSF